MPARLPDQLPLARSASAPGRPTQPHTCRGQLPQLDWDCPAIPCEDAHRQIIMRRARRGEGAMRRMRSVASVALPACRSRSSVAAGRACRLDAREAPRGFARSPWMSQSGPWCPSPDIARRDAIFRSVRPDCDCCPSWAGPCSASSTIRRRPRCATPRAGRDLDRQVPERPARRRASRLRRELPRGPSRGRLRRREHLVTEHGRPPRAPGGRHGA